MTPPASFRWSWRNLPFAQKLATLLIALVSLPIVVVVIYTTASGREALIAATRARNLERAQATAHAIDAFFADARADVRATSSLSSIVDLCQAPDDRARVDRARRSLLAMRAEQRMVALYVTDRAGRVLATTDDRAPIGSLQTGRAFLSAVAGQTAVDEPDYDPFDQRVALRVSHAVRTEAGEIIGTATGLIDVAELDELTRADANFGGTDEFGVLWSGAGLRLSSSSHRDVRFTSWAPLPPDIAVVAQQRLGPAYPSDVKGDPGLAAMLDRGNWLLYDSGTDPHLRIESRDWGPLHATAVPLPGQRWVYGIFVPESRLFATLRPQMLRDWAVAFFTVLAALVLSIIAARWVTRPLQVVTRTANALAQGDMTRRARLNQGDEFGQLGEAFDAMAAALADKERQLQAHAADLERRVEERTATLQLLERASRTLASSLELRRTAVSLGHLLVPGLADFCAIDVRDLHGNLRRVASRHADVALDKIANEFTDVRQTKELAQSLVPEERQALGLTDVRVYELTAGRRFVGHMTLGMTGKQPFSESAERICEELARRAGLALANALLYQEAEDANRLKDEFLGVVSHELRTPLNAIMGWTRLAGASRDAGIEPQTALEAVERNARALARLVDDLLDVPRIMMGKLALDVRPVDLMVVVETATNAIRPAAAGKSITVTFESSLPSATIEGDAHRLQQVFGNVLSNALKFTPPDGRIAVSLRRIAAQFVVTITDTGLGIRPDFLPFVFDRFRQADSSTTRAHGGLGIGLSLVRNLVEMHGGQVSAASEGVGLGSTFTISLPITYAETNVIDERRDDGSDALARLRDLRLLVVDDDEDSRLVASRLLAAHHARVVIAASAAEALTLLRDEVDAIDVVLADIGMPDQDGYAFIAALRADSDARIRRVPAVAVTAYASRTDRSRALDAGFDGHLAKPIDPERLAAAVALALTARARH